MLCEISESKLNLTGGSKIQEKGNPCFHVLMNHRTLFRATE